MIKIPQSKNWQEDTALRRYQMIAPLLDESLDDAKRIQLREEVARKYEISTRSLYRYEAAYKAEGFSGLKPVNREQRRSQKLPDNFDELLAQAIQLKRDALSLYKTEKRFSSMAGNISSAKTFAQDFSSAFCSLAVNPEKLSVNDICW